MQLPTMRTQQCMMMRNRFARMPGDGWNMQGRIRGRYMSCANSNASTMSAPFRISWQCATPRKADFGVVYSLESRPEITCSSCQFWHSLRPGMDQTTGSVKSARRQVERLLSVTWESHRVPQAVLAKARPKPLARPSVSHEGCHFGGCDVRQKVIFCFSPPGTVGSRAEQTETSVRATVSIGSADKEPCLVSE